MALQDENRGHMNIAGLWALWGIAFIVVCLRFYVRTKIVPHLVGWDDV